MKDFRELTVWRKAHSLVLDVYKATAGSPRHEMYGLTSQLRRAGLSIPANLAEGCGRRTDADFARFVQIAMGSASELEYLLLLSRDLELADGELLTGLLGSTQEVKRMLYSLQKRLSAKRNE